MKIAYNPLGSTVLTVPPSENDITFDLPGKAIWTKGVKFGWYTTFSKDTSTASGYSGLVPAPDYNNNSTTRFLREDGKWIIPTTYSVVSSTANGLTPKVINTNTATVDSTYYVLSSKNGSAVPSWYKLPATTFANDNTTYILSGALNGNTFVTTLTPSSGDTTAATVPVMTAATSSAAGTAGLVPAPEANKHTSFLRGDGIWSALTSNIITLTNYSKPTVAGDLETSDSLNSALGKLEYKTNIAYNWYKDITNTDTDEVINKWSEVVSFLNGVTNSESILNKFITTDTTQTITGTKTFNNKILGDIQGCILTTYGLKVNLNTLDDDNLQKLKYSTYDRESSNTPIVLDNANALITLYKSKHTTNSQYATQLAFPNNGVMYIRNVSNGTFGNWNALLSEGNYTKYAAPRVQTDFPAEKTIRISCKSKRSMLISIRGTTGGRHALVYATGYGSGTSSRNIVKILYTDTYFKYYTNTTESEDDSAIYIQNTHTDNQQNTICITELSSTTLPEIQLLDTLPTNITNIANTANTIAYKSDIVQGATKLFNQTATEVTPFSIGSSTKPVYFSNGIPVQCGSSLSVDITGNATSATNLAGGVKGSIPYQTAEGTTALLAPALVNGYVLKYNTSTNKPYWAADNNTTYITSYSVSPTAAGWIRIARSNSGIGNCSGLFLVNGTLAGYHSNLSFIANTSFGSNNSTKIDILSESSYSLQAISKVRLVHNTTYTGNYTYLEVYVTTGCTLNIKMLNNIGWVAYTTLTSGSQPSGYSVKEYLTAKDHVFKVNAQTTAGSGDIYLELWRGDKASWKILNQGGNLKFQNNYTTTVQEEYFDVLNLDYNTGNATLKGVLNTPGIGKDGYIAYPDGGYLNAKVSPGNKFLKITLPQTWCNAMLKFDVNIFNQVTNTSVTYTICGYTYSTNNSWLHPTVYAVGHNSMDLASGTKPLNNLEVRFGHDGSKCAIYIGNANIQTNTPTPITSWDICTVSISNLTMGFNNPTFNYWRNGWGISFVDTLGTITKVVKNPSVNYCSMYNYVSASSTNTDYPLVFASGTTPYLNLHTDTEIANLKYNPSTNRLTCAGSIYAASFYQDSDRVLKENIKKLSDNMLDKVYNIDEVQFNWKKNGKESFGYIAQDFEKISETFVSKNNGILTLNYVEVLVAQIAALKQKISELENKLTNFNL